MELLPKSFEHNCVVTDDEKSVYRANLRNVADVQKWIIEFAKLTNTIWTVKDTRKGRRYLCRKVYMCRHMVSQKSNIALNEQCTSQSSKCNVYIDICIELETTKNTLNKAQSAFPAIIIIRNKHNHPLKVSKKAPYLKPENKMRRIFEKYFDDGLDITQSISLYKYKLLLKHRGSKSKTAVPAVNPNFSTVKMWYKRWKDENCTNIERNKQQDNQTQNTIVKEEPSNICEEQIQNNNDKINENCRASIQIKCSDKQQSQLRNVRIQRTNCKNITQTSSVNSEMQQIDFESFCQHLAIELKNMPLDRAIICHQLLQKVMTDEYLYQLSIKKNSFNRNILPTPTFPLASTTIPITYTANDNITVQNQSSENSDDTDLQPVFDLMTNNILFIRMKNCFPLSGLQ